MNQFEKGPERIPTREEILSLIAKRCENVTVLKERSDEQGIYYLEAHEALEAGERPDETLYVYQRKGEFPGQNAAAATVLEAVYFRDGDPYGGDIIAELDPVTNEWVEK